MTSDEFEQELQNSIKGEHDCHTWILMSYESMPGWYLVFCLACHQNSDLIQLDQINDFQLVKNYLDQMPSCDDYQLIYSVMNQ